MVQVLDAWDVEEEEEEEEELPETSLEIRYVDPSNGRIVQREVFCDPNEWRNRYKSRLLISSDLVNLLSEASVARHNRFWIFHEKLEKIRLGYAADLRRLRQFIAKAMKALVVDDASPRHSGAPMEVCPVYFFLLNTYLDQWEHDRITDAVRDAKKALDEDIRELRRRIAQIGGGSWKEIMALILKRGQDPIELAKKLCAALPQDEDQQKVIENTLTDGLRDKYDELLQKYEALMVEVKDADARGEEMEEASKLQEKRISELQNRLAEIRKKLKEKPEKEYQPPIYAAQVGRVQPKEQDIGELYRKLLEQWQKKLKDIQDELARLKELIAALVKQLQETDETANLRKILAEWAAKLKLLEGRAAKLFRKKERLEKIMEELLEAIRAAKRNVKDLESKLAGMPPPDPRSVKYVKLRKLLQKIKLENKELLIKVKEKAESVKRLRYECKNYYRKLGWEWEFSDSEDEGDDEKPYWERRKLAQGKNFDAAGCLFSEKDFQSRRMTLKQKARNEEEEIAIWSQMAARRIAGNGGGIVDPLAGASEDIGPFQISEQASKAQEAERELQQNVPGASQYRLSRSTPGDDRRHVGERSPACEDMQLLPRWAHQEEELKRRCNQMVQLHELRGSLELRLRHSAACFAQAVPTDGALGGIRLRIMGALEELDDIPVAPGFFEEQQPGDRLENVSALLHGLMQEVVNLSEHVRPIAVAARHAVDFAELRGRLTEVRQSHKKLREELAMVVEATSTGFGLNVSPFAIAASAGSVAASRFSLQDFDSFLESARRTKSPPLSRTDWCQASSEGSRSFRASPRDHEDLQPTANRHYTYTRSQQQLSRQTQGYATPPVEKSGSDIAGHLPAQSSLRQSHRQFRKGGGTGVDFGFREDGGAEDSLENWSLFKVSKTKNSEMASTAMSSTMLSCHSSSSDFLKEKQRLTDSKMSKIGSNVDDFRTYVTQMQHSNPGMWKSSSSPAVNKLPDKKQFPSLPQLVKAKNESHVAHATSGGTSSAARSQTDIAFAQRWKKGRAPAASDAFAGYRGVKWREPKLAHLS